MKVVKQTYIPYWLWEDYKNGMWAKGNIDDLQKAIDFTGNYIKYGQAMKDVVEKWPNTMLNTLSNTSVNRRAFLGHCAVSFKLNISENITRLAWGLLTEKQRIEADKQAQSVIDKWVKDYEIKNRKIHKGVGKQMLFEWPS